MRRNFFCLRAVLAALKVCESSLLTLLHTLKGQLKHGPQTKKLGPIEVGAPQFSKKRLRGVFFLV